MVVSFIACDDEPTVTDLALELELPTEPVLISEPIDLAVFAVGGESEVLDKLEVLWAIGGETGVSYRGRGLTSVRFQGRQLGNQEISVIASDPDGRSVTLHGSIDLVDGAGPDGSLDMISVAEGPFVRGDLLSDTAFSYQRPQRELTLSGFRLARTEFTNGAFADIVNWAAEREVIELGGNPDFLVWREAPGAILGISLVQLSNSDLAWVSGELIVPAGLERHPLRGVDWPGAVLICNWLSDRAVLEPCYDYDDVASFAQFEVECDFTRTGYRLPTEAEWEKAGRGPADQGDPARTYPWGNGPHFWEYVLDPGAAKPQVVYGSRLANAAIPWLIERPEGFGIFPSTLPVGCFPEGAGPYGHLDLIGNVGEYCWDRFHITYYEVAPSTDPTGPTAGLERTMRGDGWLTPYIPGFDVFTVELGVTSRRFGRRHLTRPEFGLRVAQTGD